MIRYGLFASAVAIFLAFRVFAQAPDTATIEGHITDQSRAAVSGADVSIRNPATGFERETRSDAGGWFSLSGLPIGAYSLKAQRQGFAEATRDITLVSSTTAEVKIQLRVSAVDTQIQVTGAAGVVRTDEPQVGDRLGPVQVEETPVLNRRITNLPLLNAANRPALNQGDVFMNQTLFTTNGSGRRQTAWVVDGTTGNDSWGRQTIFTNVPQVAVEEMSVLENAFSAEYGATTGGVVNIVTRSGGNQYHGDFVGLWRPGATSAKLSGFTSNTVTSGNQVSTDSLGQLGAAFSGPLTESDSTHFFFAGEYTRENRGSPVTAAAAPGVFVGHYADWMALLKLDHRISSANSVFLRANTDSFHDTNPNGAVGGSNLPSVDRIFRRRTYSVEVGNTWVLSPRLLNTARAQFQLGSPITKFDPVILGTQFVVPIASLICPAATPGCSTSFTSGTSQSALLLNRQYSFDETLAASSGRHEIKFGGGLVHAHNGGNSKEFGGPIPLGQFRYKTCTQAPAVCETAYLNNITNVQSYTQSYGSASYTVDDDLWAVFVQDNYRLRGDLTVNLGLRYEEQTFTDARKNIAPRIGFAYDWRGQGKTVIRSGFGIYYAQVIDNSAANYALSGPTGFFNYTAGPGQIGFPSSVSAVPLPAFPPGATPPVASLYIRPGRAAYYDQFFPTSVLQGYPDALLSPYSEQWTFGVERQLGRGWVVSADYLGSHTVRGLRPLDVDPPTPFIRTAQGQTRSAQAANCTRPLWVKFYAGAGRSCNPVTSNPPQPAYSVIQADVNDGWGQYHALNVNLSHQFAQRFTSLISYVYSHAINNVDPDVPGGNPNDANFTGRAEKGDAIFDQRHRLVVSGTYRAPFGFNLGGVATLASSLPFNFVTGTNNSGDTGATTDRPAINGVVVGRNTGRGRGIFDLSPFVEKEIPLQRERIRIRARAEAFNVLNHANFVGYAGTYGNGGSPPAGFGQPLTGITNQLPARSLQFMLRLIY